MQRRVSEVRRIAFYSCAWAFTFLNFLAFLVSRDHDRIHNPGRAWMDASGTDFRTYPASEFERTLSCHGIGQCQRIGGAFIFQPIIFLTDSISKFYYWNVDDQSRIFIIQMIGLGWRIICLTILGLCIYRVSKNIKFALFFMNAIFFTLSGWLLRLVGYLIEKLPKTSDAFKQRSILAFQDFPYENFKWYDFGLFAVLAIIAILVIQISEKQVTFLQLFILGVLVTSFFEYLGFVLALSLTIFKAAERKTQTATGKISRIIMSVLLGSFAWLAFIAIYHKVMETLYPKFFSADLTERVTAFSHIKDVFWAIQHPIENLTSNPSIIFQIFLVIIQCAVLGLMTGFVARAIFKSVRIESNLIQSFKCVTIAMAVVIFITLFFAYGVKIQATEHARQTLGLQISLFTYIFLKTVSQKTRDFV